MKTKEFLEKLKSDKRLPIIAAVGLLGLLLLILGALGDGEKQPTQESETQVSQVTAAQVEEAIETRLLDIVSSVKGAGSVKVMVTVDSAGEYVYAENKSYERSSDSARGDNEYVIFESSEGLEAGLVLCVKNPQIQGVAVICDGGDSAVIKAEITSLVTNLFGIGANRVYVGGKG